MLAAQAEARKADCNEMYTFTKIPNVYFEEVFPYLDTTEKAIIMLVLRETIGYHQTTARITIAEFTEFTGRARSTTILAKNRLIASGLLMQIRKGGGLKSSIYGLHLDSFRDYISSNREHTPPEATSKHPAGNEFPFSSKANKNRTSQTLHNTPKAAHKREGSASPVVEPGRVLQIARTEGKKTQKTHAGPANSTGKKALNRREGKRESGQKDASTPIELGCPPVDRPINKRPLRIYTGSDFKTNTYTPENEKPVKQQNDGFKIVCSTLRSFGAKLERKDFAFVRRCIAAYGLKTVLEKLEIAKLQTGRKRKILNILGWLSRALLYDWRPAASDMAVERAQERVKREQERSERIEAQWEAKKQEVMAEQDDPATQERIQAMIAAIDWGEEDQDESQTGI